MNGDACMGPHGWILLLGPQLFKIGCGVGQPSCMHAGRCHNGSLFLRLWTEKLFEFMMSVEGPMADLETFGCSETTQRLAMVYAKTLAVGMHDAECIRQTRSMV